MPLTKEKRERLKKAVERRRKENNPDFFEKRKRIGKRQTKKTART